MKTPHVTADPIRIDRTGIYLGDKPVPGVTRWTARHEPERGVFELQLTLVTNACRVNLDAPAGQLLGGPLHACAPSPLAEQPSAPEVDTGTARNSAAWALEALRTVSASMPASSRQLGKIEAQIEALLFNQTLLDLATLRPGPDGVPVLIEVQPEGAPVVAQPVHEDAPAAPVSGAAMSAEQAKPGYSPPARGGVGEVGDDRRAAWLRLLDRMRADAAILRPHGLLDLYHRDLDVRAGLSDYVTGRETFDQAAARTIRALVESKAGYVACLMNNVEQAAKQAEAPASAPAAPASVPETAIRRLLELAWDRSTFRDADADLLGAVEKWLGQVAPKADKEVAQ